MNYRPVLLKSFLPLIADGVYLGCGDSWLGAADGSRQYGAGLVVARQDFGDAAV